MGGQRGSGAAWNAVAPAGAREHQPLLAFLPVVLSDERVAAVLQVSEQPLARRPYARAAIVGLLTLGCAALLAVAAGPWAAAGAVIAALVQVDVAAPMILMLYAVVFHPGYGLGAAAVGLAAGVVGTD